MLTSLHIFVLLVYWYLECLSQFPWVIPTGWFSGFCPLLCSCPLWNLHVFPHLAHRPCCQYMNLFLISCFRSFSGSPLLWQKSKFLPKPRHAGIQETRQADVCEFKASLVYIASSWKSRVTQWDPVSNRKPHTRKTTNQADRNSFQRKPSSLPPWSALSFTLLSLFPPFAVPFLSH